jgi:hypothetical protein
VEVPTYFKVYESKKFLSSILKLYARRLARWFSCGKLIVECHSINNFADLIRNGQQTRCLLGSGGGEVVE